MKTLNLKKLRKILQTKMLQGLLTGYYEPAIKAYHYPKKGAYPIYKHPSKGTDQSLDYQVSRKIINNGYLEDKNLEIAWVENEIEAFFLHIQGSGRLIIKQQNNEGKVCR